jgi:hypothetical protein
VRFVTQEPVKVASHTMTPLVVWPNEELPDHVEHSEDGIVFSKTAWYEVQLKVQWDASVRDGTRFAHTKVPDGGAPLHSEASTPRYWRN